jgi:hypothetical protein
MMAQKNGLIITLTGLGVVVIAAVLIWQSGQSVVAATSAPRAQGTNGPVTLPGTPAAGTPVAGTQTSNLPGAYATALQTGATPVPDTLYVVVGGLQRPYQERSAVPLSGDLMAEFAVVGGDARYERVADIYIYRGKRDQPYDDAKAIVTCQMLYMDHGTYSWEAIPVGNGHYLIGLPFNMPGEWQMTFKFEGGPKPSQVVLDINLFY